MTTTHTYVYEFRNQHNKSLENTKTDDRPLNLVKWDISYFPQDTYTQRTLQAYNFKHIKTEKYYRINNRNILKDLIKRIYQNLIYIITKQYEDTLNKTELTNLEIATF